MRLLSFGRSFLLPIPGPRASLRRSLRALLAARRRWPSGRLVVRVGWGSWAASWVVPVGTVPPGSELVGLSVSGGREGRPPAPVLLLRAVRDAHADVLAGPISWPGAVVWVLRHWREVRVLY